MTSPTIYNMSKIDIKSRLGALPSPWDNRNYRVPCLSPFLAASLPEEMFSLMPYVHQISDEFGYPDQGTVGSCVGWDGSLVKEIKTLLEGKQSVNLSAGWLYWRSRIHANVPDHIEGSTNLGLMKALRKDGATTEACCATDTKSPFEISYCENAFQIASLYKVDQYWNIPPDPASVKAAMFGLTHKANYKMSDGSPGKIPLVSAYPVYNSFYESFDNSGIVSLPQPGDSLLGGHSSALVGWKIIDGKTYYINFNSWGDEVGDHGLFYIPEDYPFYKGDFWLVHNGPPTDVPDPIPSPCNVGNNTSKILNILAKGLGRKGRFYYLNPR